MIPKKIRDEIGISSGDDVEIMVSEDGIEIIKNAPRCYLCGHMIQEDTIRWFKGKVVCFKCAQEIKRRVNSDRFSF